MIRRESSMPRELECGTATLEDGTEIDFCDWPRLVLFTVDRTGNMALGLIDDDNKEMIRTILEPEDALALAQVMTRLANSQIAAADVQAAAAIAKAKGGAA